MKADGVKVQTLLGSKVQYRVPLFQRTYNWKEEQWDQLWDDITEVYMMEEPRPHFIGAVVTQPIPDAPEKAAKHLLIDGQQRLTTLCILLTAIREKAVKGQNQILADEIYNTCLTNKMYNPTDDELVKLRPTQRDRNVFHVLVSGGHPTNTGNSNIHKAFQYFRKALDDGDPQKSPFDLPKLKDRITYYLDLVSVSLEANDSAHKIFESLNNTGLQLGASDLIRNYIFMHIPMEDEAQATYDRHWMPMQDLLEARLDGFFWRYLMMDGSLPRVDETYEEICKRNKDLSPSKATTLLKNLSQHAVYYSRILADSGGGVDDFHIQARRLRVWDMNVAYSFIMKSMAWEAEGKITLNQAIDAMRAIESFVIRRAICNVPTNRLRRIFAGMCSSITPDNYIGGVHEHLLRNEWPPDDDFQERFVEYPLYTWSRTTGRVRLVLESLERSFGEKERPVIDENITIEHVMPQTLTAEWEEMLGGQAREIHGKWLHTPGNLTLTAYNPELGNSPFDRKKDILSGSKFALSDAIVSCNTWDEHTIRARGQSLAERAVTIWARPDL